MKLLAGYGTKWESPPPSSLSFCSLVHTGGMVSPPGALRWVTGPGVMPTGAMVPAFLTSFPSCLFGLWLRSRELGLREPGG